MNTIPVFSPLQSSYDRRTANLPLFRMDLSQEVWFYAPGYLAVVPPQLANQFESHLLYSDLSCWPEVRDLRLHALAARQTWQALLTHPYAPVCLTLYLHNGCNLNCIYCYAQPQAVPGPCLSLEAVRAAGEIVAANCCERNLPFTVVFHGGGEPTLNQLQVDLALDALEGLAKKHGLDMFRYIATNGVLSAQKAAWLAQRFDRIGISCDGTPDIQASQRPHRQGRETFPLLERSALVIHQAGRALDVRVTLTPQSARRQVEIAACLCEQLRPSEIHVEPVYQAGRAPSAQGFQADEIPALVKGFLAGRQVAARYGVPWLASGSRPAEIHGPYCQVLRDVLHLIPGDIATACFLTCTSAQATRWEMRMGRLERRSGRFFIDSAHVEDLRQRLVASLENQASSCQACFNRFHCARACPDGCVLRGDFQPYDFRCQFEQQLSLSILEQAAQALREKDAPPVSGVQLA